ncbi:alkaline phosphatase D family protein [Photobacterium alginatilyticum]|uniref:Alkaline phosphatase family protein n=1 Tax=Photobacterium alginatilyticum TaxID=1775171 RepID=A0ABW9YQE4_9GAMM|nr:alkaline phosphatase D family protein [Photobacterium alginatilyticum]NBI56172.1 alkaline phosphatase family protein [Photobacterium alginatilyticum]
MCSRTASSSENLPLLLAGPILRKCTARELTLWLVTSEPLAATFSLYYPEDDEPFFSEQITTAEQIQVGQAAWVTMASIKGHFPVATVLEYQLVTQRGDITELVPSLLYPGEKRLSFTIKQQADYILHGSCRNPHYPSKDSLVAADDKLALQQVQERPALLMMSGDQIYADHVAGPTLDAIQQVIGLLGLPDETFAQGPVANTQSLYQHGYNFYGRDKILPHYVESGNWLSDNGLRKWLPKRGRPVFSSRECENHLMSFSEFFAMYLLVWSPQLWQLVDGERLEKCGFMSGQRTLESKWQQLWHQEKRNIDEFVAGLPQVQRLMAHIPTYMIFDDHDITDDWNLTVGWEKAAYGNLLSRRIIGNGLISYWLCQGWGNAPEHFDQEFLNLTKSYFSEPVCERQDKLINHLYRFEQWHYTIETTPKMLVLDTRTRRWRSESKMNKPSGLMDWEALTELQQSLLNEPAVIIVSAAPMFGVKFIEMLQRGMTWLGQPLLIDAENWMAHPGSANTLLSIFTHTKTPTNFVILSGDVHYSFAYDVKLRFRRSSPNIYQITSSGIKNEFPNALLRFCDVMDRALYSPHSPLNWLTKRKRLKIKKRDPDTTGNHRLINRSAIGELYLDSNGKPSRVEILTAEGDTVSFLPIEKQSTEHVQEQL